MRFMMFMYPADFDEEDWNPTAEAVAEMSRYNEELRKAGMLLALDGLRPPVGRGVGRLRGPGEARVVDGPFTEAKELVGGYWIIQARSTEEAVEWAKRCPGERLPGRGAADLRNGGLLRRGAGGARLRPGPPPGGAGD